MGTAAISNLPGEREPECLKSRLIVRGGTQLRAVREAPGRGWRQGAWTDRAVILKEMSLRE